MRAVVVDPTSVQRRRGQPQAHFEIRDVPTPEPPAPGWVVVRPSLSGICVTDLAMIECRTTPTPLAAFGPPGPFIPGHEVVGVVSAARGTRNAREGVRVILDPRLRCRHKGLPECPRCAAGDVHLCENRDRSGALCGGHGIGLSAGAGGGWSEGILAHEEMLIPAGDLPDQRAVLADPLAGALHAVTQIPATCERVAVIGSGTRSRLIIATLAQLRGHRDITVIYDARREDRTSKMGRARREVAAHIQVDFAGDAMALQAIGADRVWRGSPEQLLDDAADHLGARRLRAGGVAQPVLDRGFDAIFDCRATEASIDLSLRLLRGGGTLVMVGRPGRQSVDWSLVWDRELSIRGIHGHPQSLNGRRTLAAACELLAEATFPVDGLVTHRYPLEDIDKAVASARGGAALGAVKVVLQDPAERIATRADDVPEMSDLSEPILGAIAARVRVEEPV